MLAALPIRTERRDMRCWSGKFGYPNPIFSDPTGSIMDMKFARKLKRGLQFALKKKVIAKKIRAEEIEGHSGFDDLDWLFKKCRQIEPFDPQCKELLDRYRENTPISQELFEAAKNRFQQWLENHGSSLNRQEREFQRCCELVSGKFSFGFRVTGKRKEEAGTSGPRVA